MQTLLFVMEKLMQKLSTAKARFLCHVNLTITSTNFIFHIVTMIHGLHQLSVPYLKLVYWMNLLFH